MMNVLNSDSACFLVPFSHRGSDPRQVAIVLHFLLKGSLVHISPAGWEMWVRLLGGAEGGSPSLPVPGVGDGLEYRSYADQAI